MGKRYFTKEDTEMANKHRKRYETSLGFQQMKIKTMMWYYYTHVRMGKSIKTTDTEHWQRFKKHWIDQTFSKGM